MQIHSTRFGSIQMNPSDLFMFQHGLIGFEDCHRWVLLADAHSSQVGWLQSAASPEIAVAVVSPRVFAPEYKFRVGSEQVAAIELADLDRAFVLCVVSKKDDTLTANLKAPLVFNLDRRLGCQVIASDDQPLQLELTARTPKLRRIA